MPKLKREFFLRPTRMVHRFGQKDDPVTDAEYFEFQDPRIPKRVKGTASLGIKEHGLAVYTEPFSGIDKFKGGRASLSGPKPDCADEAGEREPASTKRRRVPDGAI